MTEKTAILILSKMHDDGISSTALQLIDAKNWFRSLGWQLAKWLSMAIDGLYSGLAKICGALSFAKSDSMQNLVNTYSKLLYAVLIVAVVGLGFYLIIKKNNNQLSFVQNVVLCVLICAAMPAFTAKMNALTTGAVNGVLDHGYTSSTIKGNYKNVGGKVENAKWKKGAASGVTSIVIANNIVDLKAVDSHLDDKNGHAVWRSSGKGHKAKGYIDGSSILNGTWKKIDINEVMDYDDDDFKYEKVWSHKLKSPELGAKSKWKDMDKLIDKLQTCYYRWQVLSWFNILAMLFIMMIVLLLALVKCARIVFEVAQANVYMPFIAASDLAVGQRTKEGIKNFVSLFAAMFLCIALLGVYFVGFSWIESKDWNAFLRIIAQLALAWATIDGPNVIERIIGIDVGLKSAWSMFMGARAATDVANGFVKGGFGIGKGIGKAGYAAGSKAADFAFGKKSPKDPTFTDGKRHGGIRGIKRGEGFKGDIDPTAQKPGGERKNGTNKPGNSAENKTKQDPFKKSSDINADKTFRNNKDSAASAGESGEIHRNESLDPNSGAGPSRSSSTLDPSGVENFKQHDNLRTSSPDSIRDRADDFANYKKEVKKEVETKGNDKK